MVSFYLQLTLWIIINIIIVIIIEVTKRTLPRALYRSLLLIPICTSFMITFWAALKIFTMLCLPLIKEIILIL